jgi:hypothetical protein
MVSGKLFRNPSRDRFERFIELRCIVSTRLSEVRTPSPLAAHERCDRLDQVARANFVGIVLGHSRCEADSSIIDRTQHHDSVLQLVFEAINRVAQRFGIGRFRCGPLPAP